MNSLEKIKKWRKREEHFIKVGASEIFDQQIEDIDWLITEVERLRNGWDQWSKQNRETDYQHRHREWALKEARCNHYAARASYKEQNYLADQVERLRKLEHEWTDRINELATVWAQKDICNRLRKAEAQLKDAEYRWQCERKRRIYLGQMLREIKGRAIQGIQYRPTSALFDIKERIEKFETEKTPAGAETGKAS